MGIEALYSAVATTERAFTVLGTQGGQVLVRLGTVQGAPGQRTQDPCALTTDVVLLDGPGDQFGMRTPGPLAGYLAGVNNPYRNITLSGRLAPQAKEIGEIRFAARSDMQLVAARGIVDVCQLVLIAGVQCIPCRPNGAPTCLDIAFEDGVAMWDRTLPTLSEVTPQSRAAAACP